VTRSCGRCDTKWNPDFKLVLVPCAVITQRVAVAAAPRIWRAVWF
jgi:hypothetical protein